MKKFLLILVGLTLISCGGNEDDVPETTGRTTDPIIGVWAELDSDGTELDRDATFNSNGTFLNIISDGQVSGTWVNNGSDFDALTQVYTLTITDSNGVFNSELTINFSSDFNSWSGNDSGTIRTYRRR